MSCRRRNFFTFFCIDAVVINARFGAEEFGSQIVHPQAGEEPTSAPCKLNQRPCRVRPTSGLIIEAEIAIAVCGGMALVPGMSPALAQINRNFRDSRAQSELASDGPPA